MDGFDKAAIEPILNIGDHGVSLRSILIAGAILGAAALAIWIIRQLIVRAQARLGEGRASTLYVAGQVARYIIVFAALAAAISALGVDLSALSLFAGALGVGIGLGLQERMGISSRSSSYQSIRSMIALRQWAIMSICSEHRSLDLPARLNRSPKSRGLITFMSQRCLSLVEILRSTTQQPSFL